MKKREDIVQKFSTFLSFSDRGSGYQSFWQTEPQLERQIKKLMQLDPEAKEEFWAKHFLKMLRKASQLESNTKKIRSQTQGDLVDITLCTSSFPINSTQISENSTLITARHLSAYLQEACLWAAQKSYHKYNFLRHKYSIEDYFQIASSFANLPTKLFKRFNIEHPRSHIENYAKIALFRLIRDKIYQQDLEAKRSKFSDYGLLKDLNVKELKEALAFQGFNQSKINVYQLVWQCFNEVYQPLQKFNSRNLEPPNRKILKQTADYFNQRLYQLNLPKLVANEDKIQEILVICIKAARNYRTKQFFPLEKYDNIPDTTLTSWDIVILEEEREQVQLLISKLFTTVTEPGQVILILWQGLNLTQSEIATILKSKYPELQKQYQVARYLARCMKILLKDFITNWHQLNPYDPIDNKQSLKIIYNALHECLQIHCQRLIKSIWEEAIREIGNVDTISEAKLSLSEVFMSKLATKLGLNDVTLSIDNKLSFLAEEWFLL